MTDIEKLEEIENFIEALTQKTFTFQLSSETTPIALLGSNALCLLCKVLNYSLSLNIGVLTLYKNKNISSAILLIRSNFEAAGILANFYDKMLRYYNKTITLEEYDGMLVRYLLGSKSISFPDIEVPDPINVLNGIDSIDKWLYQNSGDKSGMIRDSYNYLSEFCHPNFHGTSLCTTISSERVVSLKSQEEIFIRHSDEFFLYFQLSNKIILDLYEKIILTLKAYEVLPIFNI